MAEQIYTPGSRFTVQHNKTSKERLEYLKDVMGVTSTSQVIHLALQQYYRTVRDEEETKRGKLVV